MYVNGKQIPNEDLSTNFGYEKTSVMSYRTVFKGSGINYSNASNQIAHDMSVNGYFMLFFDITPDQAASEGHVSPASKGHIRLNLKFAEALPEALVFCTWSTTARCVLTQIDPFPLSISNNGHSTDCMHTS
jgi:hypothetical protein